MITEPVLIFQTLKGRSVRISLPNDEEQNKDRGSRSGGTFSRREMSDRNDRSERPLGEWRAAVPVPHDPDKAGILLFSEEEDKY